MKILFFTENSYRGGLDSFLVSLINHWPGPEDELILFCNASHPGLEGIRQSLVRPCIVIAHRIPLYSGIILRARQNRLLDLIRKIFSPLMKYSFFLYYILRIRAELVRNNPDRLMVVNGGHPGGDSCRAAIISWGIFRNSHPRAIYNFHNLATSARWFEKWPEKLIDFLVLKYSKALIGVSRVCAKSFELRIGERNISKIAWIYNGISTPSTTAKFQSVPFREELGLPSDTDICLMLATYEPRKGHDFLLRAFKKVISEIPRSRLVICGHGYPKEVERVKNLVIGYDLSPFVVLQGYRRDIDSLLDQSDLLLVASQSFESFGLTCVEAMAHRVPIVGTRVGGIPEVVVDGEGGFCVEPDDVEGYAEKMVRLLRDPELRRSQGEKGYQRFHTLFSADRMAEEYARIIHAKKDQYCGA